MRTVQTIQITHIKNNKNKRGIRAEVKGYVCGILGVSVRNIRGIRAEKFLETLINTDFLVYRKKLIYLISLRYLMYAHFNNACALKCYNIGVTCTNRFTRKRLFTTGGNT